MHKRFHRAQKYQRDSKNVVFFVIGVNGRVLSGHRQLLPISIQGIAVFVLNDGLYLDGCISARMKSWDEKRHPRDEDALFVLHLIDVQREFARYDCLMMIWFLRTLCWVHSPNKRLIDSKRATPPACRILRTN